MAESKDLRLELIWLKRVPIFSARSVDGTKVENIDRRDVWKYDLRISTAYQILKEV